MQRQPKVMNKDNWWPSMDRWSRLFPAITLGSIAAWSYAIRFIVPRQGLSQLQLLALGLYLVTFFTLVSWFILRLLMEDLGRSASRARALLYIATHLGLGLLAVSVIPVTPAVSWPSYHRLSVTALGERNAAASGSEVWILGLPDGTSAEQVGQEVSASPTWEQRPTGLVSFEDQPASLSWEGWSVDSASIIFLQHPWSGKALVEIDGERQTIDLFAAQSSVLTISVGRNTVLDGMLKALTWAADAVLMGVGLWFALVLVRRLAPSLQRSDVSFNRRWLMCAGFCAFVWTGYLLIFWPGFFSNDSIDQWRQVVRGVFYDAHPAFHTMINWLVTRLWLSPAAIGLLQIAALALAFGWGFAIASELGADQILVAGAVVLAAIAPMNGLLVISLWKDVLYSAALVGLSLATLRIALSKGAWLSKKRHFVAFVSVAVLTALLRHNGISAAFATPVLLAFFVERRFWLRLAAALSATLASWAFIRGPIYDWANVTRLEDPRYTLAPFMSVVAAHVNAGTPLSPDEKAFVDSIRPSQTPWPFSCYDISSLFYTDALNWTPAVEDEGQLILLSAELSVRNPIVTFKERACRLSTVWRITPPRLDPDYYVQIDLNSNKEWAVVYQSWIVDEWALEFPNVAIPSSESIWPQLATWMARQYHASLVSSYAFLWRPAIYLYLFIIGVVLWAGKASNRAPLALLVPMSMHIALLIALMPAQDLRYMYPAIALAFGTWPVLLTGIRNSVARGERLQQILDGPSSPDGVFAESSQRQGEGSSSQ